MIRTQELYESLARNAGVTPKQARAVVDALRKVVVNEVAEGRDFQISGVFSLRYEMTRGKSVDRRYCFEEKKIKDFGEKPPRPILKGRVSPILMEVSKGVVPEKKHPVVRTPGKAGRPRKYRPGEELPEGAVLG